MWGNVAKKEGWIIINKVKVVIIKEAAENGFEEMSERLLLYKQNTFSLPHPTY
jgi:hypothetical protein